MKDDMPNLRKAIRKLESVQAEREVTMVPALVRLLMSGKIQNKRPKEPPRCPLNVPTSSSG